MCIQYWALRYVMPSRSRVFIHSPCSRFSLRSAIALPNLFPSSGMPAAFSALSSARKESTASRSMSFLELLKFDVTSNLTTAVAAAMSLLLGPSCHGEDKLASYLRDRTAEIDGRGNKPRCRNGTVAVGKTAIALCEPGH